MKPDRLDRDRREEEHDRAIGPGERVGEQHAEDRARRAERRDARSSRGRRARGAQGATAERRSGARRRRRRAGRSAGSAAGPRPAASGEPNIQSASMLKPMWTRPAGVQPHVGEGLPERPLPEGGGRRGEPGRSRPGAGTATMKTPTFASSSVFTTSGVCGGPKRTWLPVPATVHVVSDPSPLRHRPARAGAPARSDGGDGRTASEAGGTAGRERARIPVRLESARPPNRAGQRRFTRGARTRRGS